MQALSRASIAGRCRARVRTAASTRAMRSATAPRRPSPRSSAAKAVVGLVSRLDKPFVLDLVALLERLDTRRKHVLDGGEATGIDLPLRVAGDVLR